MKNRDYLKDTDKIMASIKKGAFLTVKAQDKCNTMTIGWATIGYIWQRPVFMIAVRDSRHTFSLLEQTDNYTVTVPAGDAFKDAVAFCGTKSKLAVKQAQQVQSPIIDIPGIHYECKIIYKSAMDNKMMDSGLENLYPKKDYHTLYFGEIVACYETE